MAEQAEFSDIGDNVVHVEQLLKEHKKLQGEGQVCLFVSIFVDWEEGPCGW